MTDFYSWWFCLFGVHHWQHKLYNGVCETRCANCWKRL